MINKILVLSVLMVVASFASADYTSKWCISDDPGKCPVKPTYGCPQAGGPGAQELSKAACTIYNGNEKKVLPFRITTLSSDGGGQCGISVYEVTCIEH